MAGSSLLVLLDDIAAVLDDVATMTKVAARKTAGVLGDDLAVNAEKVTGVRAERELPVVWAVAKGSFRNKCILVPAALALSLVAPWLIPPLLILGGLFLCYEGFEKVAHRFLHSPEEDAAQHAQLMAGIRDPQVDLVKYEQRRIQGAIRTDMILSAEIIVLTLGIVAAEDFVTQVLVVSGIALVMTVGVYGLVAGIVKLDDAGQHLSERGGEGVSARSLRWLGGCLLAFAPRLMKALSVIGTIAMFMVGGGILVHGFHALDAAIDALAVLGGEVPALGPLLLASVPLLGTIAVGMLAGAVVLLLLGVVKRLRAAF